MSITTKTGDKGKTSLCWGGMADKCDERIETYGALDELCSILGFSKSLLKDRKAKTIVESVQRDLFLIGAEVATKRKFLGRLKKRLDCKYIDLLEKEIVRLEKKLKLKNCCFLLPGENTLSASLDMSRTIARRVERMAVALSRKKIIDNPAILIYLNRLSDLLYLLARSFEKKHRILKLR